MHADWFTNACLYDLRKFLSGEKGRARGSVGIPSGIPYGIPKIDGIPFGIPNGTWYLGFPFRGLYLRYEDGIIHCGEGLPIPRGLASVGGVGIPMSKSGLADLRCL